MMKLFSPDSPLMIWLRKITDYMILGFIWLVASLPVITFGASTTAMIVAGEKVIRKEEGKLLFTGGVGGHLCPRFTDAAPAAAAVGILSDPGREAAKRRFGQVYPGISSYSRQ